MIKNILLSHNMHIVNSEWIKYLYVRSEIMTSSVEISSTSRFSESVIGRENEK